MDLYSAFYKKRTQVLQKKNLIQLLYLGHCIMLLTAFVCVRDLRIGIFRSNRISNPVGGYDSNSNLGSKKGVVVYMSNADCHVGVVYLLMCKTIPYCTLRCIRIESNLEASQVPTMCVAGRVHVLRCVMCSFLIAVLFYCAFILFFTLVLFHCYYFTGYLPRGE